MAVTPLPGNASEVTTGGTAVTAVLAVPAGVGGGYITNPLAIDDQGVDPAEPLYINPVTTATLSANGTTFAAAAASRRAPSILPCLMLP